jgi:hypothetical protein
LLFLCKTNDCRKEKEKGFILYFDRFTVSGIKQQWPTERGEKVERESRERE